MQRNKQDVPGTVSELQIHLLHAPGTCTQRRVDCGKQKSWLGNTLRGGPREQQKHSQIPGTALRKTTQEDNLVEVFHHLWLKSDSVVCAFRHVDKCSYCDNDHHVRSCPKKKADFGKLHTEDKLPLLVTNCQDTCISMPNTFYDNVNSPSYWIIIYLKFYPIKQNTRPIGHIKQIP